MDIMEIYAVLKLHGGFSTFEIDELSPNEVKYYLNEVQKLIEKKPF
jgi:hypothetical protein